MSAMEILQLALDACFDFQQMSHVPNSNSYAFPRKTAQVIMYLTSLLAHFIAPAAKTLVWPHVIIMVV